MRNNSVSLTVDELHRIIEVLAKFPDVAVFNIEEYNQSEIGSCTDIKFEHQINDVPATIAINITNESHY